MNFRKLGILIVLAFCAAIAIHALEPKAVDIPNPDFVVSPQHFSIDFEIKTSDLNDIPTLLLKK